MDAVSPVRFTLSYRTILRVFSAYILDKFWDQLKGVAPLTLFLLAFQFLVFRILQMENPLGIAAGMCCVVAGLAFFLNGLRLGVMPLGENIGSTLPAKGKLGIILAAAFILGTVATLAEPAINTLNVLGQKISPQQTPLLFDYLNKRTGLLLLCVACGVGFGASIGILRVLRGWTLKMCLLPSLAVGCVVTVLAARDPHASCLVGVAWDAGGITTGTVTAPLLLALGVGMAAAIGRNKDGMAGFGLITLCSLWAVIFFLTMAVFHSRSGAFMSPAECEAFALSRTGGAAGQVQPNMLALIGTNLVAAAQAIVPLCLILLLVQRLVLREPIRNIQEIATGIAFSLAGLLLFQIGLERGLNPLGDQVGRNSIVSFSGKGFESLVPGLGPDGRYGPFWGKAIVLLFGFLAGYAAALAEPALAALGLTVEDVTAGAFRKRLVVHTVGIGVGTGLAIGVAKILFGWPVLATIGTSYALVFLLTLVNTETFVCIGWDSGGVASGDITAPVLIALGLGAGTAVGAPDCFSLIAMGAVWPIIAVQAMGLFVTRLAPLFRIRRQAGPGPSHA